MDLNPRGRSALIVRSRAVDASRADVVAENEAMARWRGNDEHLTAHPDKLRGEHIPGINQQACLIVERYQTTCCVPL